MGRAQRHRCWVLVCSGVYVCTAQRYCIVRKCAEGALGGPECTSKGPRRSLRDVVLLHILHWKS